MTGTGPDDDVAWARRGAAAGFDIAVTARDPGEIDTALAWLAGARGARAGAGAHKNRKAHLACRIDAEVARNDGGPIDHTRTGKAFRHEPVFQMRRHLLFILGHHLDPDQQRDKALAGGSRQPVVREDAHFFRVKGAGTDAGGKGGIGDELGMAFPFQLVPSDGAGKMRGLGLRMRAAVAVQKIDQMRAVARAVAIGGIERFLVGQEHGGAGHLQRRKRPR